MASQNSTSDQLSILLSMAFNETSAETSSADDVEYLLKSNLDGPYLVGKHDDCGTVIVIGRAPIDTQARTEMTSGLTCLKTTCDDCPLTEVEYCRSKKSASLTNDLWVNRSLYEHPTGFTAHSMTHKIPKRG
ncbi:hypothetical protein L486_05068 [Kwoniella mangroviensis CBS 10435]|uniref:Uncharacterized protein n=1 Tax=Kwoniella mangroviensis CBS 10435 TaxID=1331196 RepID=A0A1B9IPX5_9TREE|nr:hypothetical protein L486_05068 [Kwoniella mangroviensis CBS 10435]